MKTTNCCLSILFAVLTAIWALCLLVLTWFAVDFNLLSYHLQVKDGQGSCTVVGVPRRAAAPIYSLARTKPFIAGKFSAACCFDFPRDAQWVHRSKRHSSRQYSGRYRAEAIKRADISFALDDVLHYLNKHGEKLSDRSYGQCAGFSIYRNRQGKGLLTADRCIIGDMNQDGQPEAIVENSQGSGTLFSGEVIEYQYSVYRTVNGQPVSCKVIDCGKIPLEFYPLPDGRCCFANKPMIWSRQALCWDGGAVVLKRQEVATARNPMVQALLQTILYPWTLLSGLVPALLLLLLCLPLLRSPAPGRGQLYLTLLGLTVPLIILAGHAVFCYLNGYQAAIGYALGADALPLVTMGVFWGWCLWRIVGRAKDSAGQQSDSCL